MKDNKFTKFINDNDIATNNQAYVITKILCNKNSQKKDEQPYFWFKLLAVKSYEKDGSIVKQIYILDYFTRNIDAHKDIPVGALVNYELSQMIGKKCSIVEIHEVL